MARDLALKRALCSWAQARRRSSACIAARPIAQRRCHFHTGAIPGFRCHVALLGLLGRLDFVVRSFRALGCSCVDHPTPDTTRLAGAWWLGSAGDGWVRETALLAVGKFEALH